MLRHTNPDLKPAALEVLADEIPEQLKAHAHWVVWAWIWNPHRQQWDKPPKMTDGRPASSTDPATWCTFEEAIASAHPGGRWDGIGFVLTAELGIVGIDFDDCRNPEDGDLEEWALGWLKELQTYTEASPSGLGARAFALATLPPGRRKAGPLELYIEGRYLTVTGQRLGRATELQVRQEAVNSLWVTLAPELSPAAAVTPAASPLELSDQELLERASTAKNGVDFWQLYRGVHAQKSPSEADLALCNHLAFWAAGDASRIDRLFRSSGLMRPKWDERHGADTYGGITIAKALDGLTDVYTPGGEAGEIRSSPNGQAPAATSGPQHEIYSAADLEDESIPAARSVIPGVIHVGLNMLAGKGKLGKSWIALNAALAVATGGKALGSVDVAEGDVLYLALEDNKRRMQERIGQLLGKPGFPRRLYVAHTWAKLDEGGLEAVDGWIEQHPQARLVIVDVWKRIRHKRARNANLYDEDYEHLTGLQAIAIKRDIAVLVIHHTRKAVAEDVFDEINGSGGVLAALDTCIILHRSRSEADGEIWVTGRDLEEAHLALRFEAGAWSLLGQATEVAKSRARREVLEAVIELGRPVTPAEVAKHMGKSANTVRQLIFKMHAAGELVSLQGSTYLPKSYAVTPNTHNTHNGGHPASGGEALPALPVTADADARAHKAREQRVCPTCGSSSAQPLGGGRRRCWKCGQEWQW